MSYEIYRRKQQRMRHWCKLRWWEIKLWYLESWYRLKHWLKG